MTVAVYIIKSTDTNINGITFKYGAGYTVYYYDTKDDSGGISSLIPHITYKEELDWDGNYGNIVKLKNFNVKDWSDSKYIFSVSNDDLKDYDNWLESWVNEDKQYSLFENTNEFVGRTTEDFIKDSLSFFAMRGVEKLYLTPPEVKMYTLKWSTKLSINGNTKNGYNYLAMFNWYQTLAKSNIIDLEEVISCINTTQFMYYHEYINGEHRYWLLHDAEIVPIYKKIIIDFNKSHNNIQSNSQSNFQYIQSCPNTSMTLVTDFGINPPNNNTTTDTTSSGLILVVVLIAILIIMVIIALIIIKVTGEETLIAVTEPIPVQPIPTPTIAAQPIPI
jgi:hypothetical protein